MFGNKLCHILWASAAGYYGHSLQERQAGRESWNKEETELKKG